MLNIMIFRSLTHPSLFVLLCCFANFYVMGTTSSSLPFAFCTCTTVARGCSPMISSYVLFFPSLSWRMVFDDGYYIMITSCVVLSLSCWRDGWIRSFFYVFGSCWNYTCFSFAWEVCWGMEYYYYYVFILVGLKRHGVVCMFVWLVRVRPVCTWF